MAGLKEAEYNGEYSLTYIDTVLDNWDKQGFKTEEDINKGKQSNPKEDEIPFIEVDESDWIYQ
jgi:DNA replication protein DnaD